MASHDRRDVPVSTDVPRSPEPTERIIDLTGAEAQPAWWAEAERSWTVDLAGSERRTGPHPSRPRRRPRLAVGVAALALLLLTVVGAVALVNHRRGAQWREIALQQAERGALLEERLEDAAAVVADVEAAMSSTAADRDAARAALEEVGGRLGTSEQDVAALEQRLAVLASDKARLEDELALAGQARRDAAEADELLVQCVQNVGEWLERAPEADGDEGWRRWADEAATWEALCDRATTAVR